MTKCKSISTRFVSRAIKGLITRKKKLRITKRDIYSIINRVTFIKVPVLDCAFISSRVIVTREHYAVRRKHVGCNPISVFLNKYSRYVRTLNDEVHRNGRLVHHRLIRITPLWIMFPVRSVATMMILNIRSVIQLESENLASKFENVYWNTS